MSDNPAYVAPQNQTGGLILRRRFGWPQGSSFVISMTAARDSLQGAVLLVGSGGAARTV